MALLVGCGKKSNATHEASSHKPPATAIAVQSSPILASTPTLIQQESPAPIEEEPTGQQQRSPAGTADTQTSSKPIFTSYPPFLCVGGGFVAMAGIDHRAPLIVIAIDPNGIEAPQTIPSVGDAVFGIQCSGSHVGLLVNDYKSGRFLVLLYTIRQDTRGLTTIREEQREDPEDLNLPKSLPTPPAAEHRRDSFDWIGSRAGGHMRGDWYVWVPQVIFRPNNTYEVHFVSGETGGVAKLTVTLLEETLDMKKVTKSVPLVDIEAPEVKD